MFSMYSGEISLFFGSLDTLLIVKDQVVTGKCSCPGPFGSASSCRFCVVVVAVVSLLRLVDPGGRPLRTGTECAVGTAVIDDDDDDDDASAASAPVTGAIRAGLTVAAAEGWGC